MGDYKFDRYLRFDDMVAWLNDLVARFPHLISLESYGKSNEGRDLWLATITDTSAGAHHTKPAQWIDANIHSVEVTSGVAALNIIEQLVKRYGQAGHEVTTEALRSRTFYIAPRVNPDGVEDALLDHPIFHRSSTRAWPYRDGLTNKWPGLSVRDIDEDGSIRTMRIPDPDGAWTEHPDEPRVMVPVGPLGAPTGKTRYRLLNEGMLNEYDGFTIPLPRDPAGLDLNRNFPAGWGTSVTGSGDHPLSEPEIDCLVRAVRARPNVCGYNAFHTSGGVLLRPSSTKSDSSLPPLDVWAYKEMGKYALGKLGYNVHSCFEDFTWDKSETMSGASDDWAYEHLGVFSWTTEFWDVVHHATGKRSGTDVWFIPPAPEVELAVCKWADLNAPGSYATWKSFQHPQLGLIEIGGCDYFNVWTNPPREKILAEVTPHVDFAVYQALASPKLEIKVAEAENLGGGLYKVKLGVANTGWFGTTVSKHAEKHDIVLPITALITSVPAADAHASRAPLELLDGFAAKVKLGQLEGRAKFLVSGDAKNDGTPDRCLHFWVMRGVPGQAIKLTVTHPRAGTAETTLTLR